MTLSELQLYVSEDWKKYSKNSPEVELQLLYIIEELGEVAEAIRRTSGAKTRKDVKVNLGSELADLIIAITTLANHFDVNLDSEIEAFKIRMAKRHNDGF